MSKKKPNVASFLGAVARGSIKDRSIKKYYQVQKVGALGAAYPHFRLSPARSPEGVALGYKFIILERV